MATMERGNVVLQVADDDIQRYLDKGFSLTDGKGNIIKQAIPNNIGDLQRLVVKYENEVKELKKQIEELKSQKNVTEVPEENADTAKRKRKKVTE